MNAHNANDVVIGIDLGTTNSAVAVCREGRIDIVPIGDEELLPSCVAFDDSDELIVGRPALNQLVLHPKRTVRSIKRKMGSGEMVQLGERTFSPAEISAMILRELAQRAQAFVGTPVTRAVITVPAYFSDAQRQATREAGAMAGLEVLRIVNEPTAACLAYETHESHKAHTIMAYDFGGGTFDVSIVNMEQDLVEVSGSHGDTQLGGDDIDQAILAFLTADLLQDDEEVTLTDVAENRLRRAAENAKMRLSEETRVRVIEDNLETEDGQRLHLDKEFTRSDLHDLVEDFLDRTVQCARQAMKAAGVTPRDLDEILLVGGSTRLTSVRERLQQEFGLTPRADLHPELAVVYGAGVMAGRLMGQPDQRILVDITPYTFGTSAYGNVNGDYCPFLFCPLIPAGTPLPARRSDTFATVVPGQQEVVVTAFEGEHQDARRNILIGKFNVEGLDPDAPADSPIIIAMELDLDGILRVSATEQNTGLTKDIVIDRVLQKASDDQIQASREQIEELFGKRPLAKAADQTQEAEDDGTAADKSEPVDEDDPTHALRRDARALLHRLHQAIEQMDDVDRQDAVELEERLRDALKEQNEETVRKLMTEIDDLLFYVDSAT